MMAPLHQYLDATDCHQLLDFLAHLLGREYIGIIVALFAHERAEGAIHVADVRVVDVAVNDVGDTALRMFPLAHHVRQRTQLEECQGVIETNRFRGRDPHAVEDLALNCIKRRIVNHGSRPPTAFPSSTAGTAEFLASQPRPTRTTNSSSGIPDGLPGSLPSHLAQCAQCSQAPGPWRHAADHRSLSHPPRAAKPTPQTQTASRSIPPTLRRDRGSVASHSAYGTRAPRRQSTSSPRAPTTSHLHGAGRLPG